MTFVIRPANMDDLQPIYEMAKRTGGGFTNLPPDKKALSAKLERSAAGFSRVEDEVADDLYVFVLQNSVTGEVRGTCQIFGKVGQRWPFYSYRIGALTQHSVELERTFRADILNLSTDLEGTTEVGGLFLHPGERAGGLGMLIARTRYLFIRNHRQRFADRTIAELRGVIDEAGGSPFWDGVAGRFFGMSFQEADEFNAKFGNQFIADLMPKHPVYIAMLQESAKTVIGVPHPSGRAAMRMLENEGFAWENYVDIFDGGPTMTARTDHIKSIRDATDVTVTAVSESVGEHKSGEKKLITLGRLLAFKAAYGWIDDKNGDVIIDADIARALDISAGDQITYVERS